MKIENINMVLNVLDIECTQVTKLTPEVDAESEYKRKIVQHLDSAMDLLEEWRELLEVDLKLPLGKCTASFSEIYGNAVFYFSNGKSETHGKMTHSEFLCKVDALKEEGWEVTRHVIPWCPA